MRQWIFWRILWQENSYILQAATTPSKEAENVYSIHVARPCKQVLSPNLLRFHFSKWIRLDSARVLQLSQQQRFQGAAIHEGLPSEPEFFQVEQVSPVIADNEFNLQLQHWWTGNFNTDGLVTTDYLRAKTAYLNILQLNSGPCVKME